ncbi:putative transcription elongation factor B polypeptide 3 binding protein 1 isoform 1 [Operophtera brumata]|uniref:Putative transcription elongation factor B polypeptide 3 binding protein 1 isoform 1 n=1 Tax=Operophtera brumata TaxID=104452 RepID=A0A0L7L3S8_OPEBR|nr:putative transcription elongation factor B polypeptide 3 binding protein 1 isoform 1 [Operophtera brumata]
MLPSTGYFKGIICPFNENGLCERPYCHYRHVDFDESGAILQKLVSAAVIKALQQNDTLGTKSSAQLQQGNAAANTTTSTVTSSSWKATYNPTPIAELNKINSTDTENLEDPNELRRRHIPVPYTPRKPAGLPIKRSVDINDPKPFIYNPPGPPLKYKPGGTETVPNDKYTPAGTVESKEQYLPGTEKVLQEYTPDTNAQISPSKLNYVPSSDKSVNKKRLLEYKPAKVAAKTDKPLVTYQPTPRALAPCFSSDEEEPEAKKRKISSDLNGFDDLGPEFDILDQILDEEKPNGKAKSNDKDKLPEKPKPSRDSEKCNDDTHRSKSEKKSDESKSEKKTSEENHKTKSERKSSNANHKSKSDMKEKTDEKDKKEKKEHKKSSHKSSSKDTEKEKREKHSSDSKKHSSRSLDQSPKHSKNSSSKKTEKRSESRSSKAKEKNSKEKRHKKSKDKGRHRSENRELGSSDYETLDTEENGLEAEDYDLSDADEDAIALECKRIFEEYVPTAKPIADENLLTDNLTEEEYIPSKKRVSRTIEKNIKVIPKVPVKPDFKVSAANTMAERLSKVREFHSSRNKHSSSTTNPSQANEIKDNPKIEVQKPTFSAPNPVPSKIRIAHVAYASAMLNTKKTIAPSQAPGKIQPSSSTTICQTVKKGVQRVAHMPSEKFIDRPGVLEPLASKIPANIRSIYLNMMIDECLKLYLSTHDAYARAQHEELNTSKKCSTVPIYKNSAVLAVSRLRKELVECNGVKKSANDCSTLKPDSSLKAMNSGSWSIESKNRKVYDNSHEFNGAKFYENIQKWVLTEEQLQENSFPRPHESGKKGRAIIYGQNRQNPPKGYIRTCCRCKKEYTVDKKGFPVVKEECIYHPNRKYRVRGEARYQCCSQDGTSDGCCVAPNHVYEYVDFENLKGYVKTLPPERQMDDYGVYSLDCEMCYTTNGLDLTRVTVINSACKVVYETLIKPLHPIIDYNTRYSGITEEQMCHVKTSLLEVQATLLAMFSSKTILVGHSLESDFKALKLIHDTVIDTSVLFPHKMGPPFKRALRNLSSEYLKKIIQNSVDGHDSAEDAMVCMELLQYKLKEDLKTR